ncbi:MAG: TOMM precursor leader peptide-binding protein [Phycisphaerae bacterium]|nr:TOMM precursor leader peptide-binding protein [Phycisphaerae bacterium]
MPRYRLKPHLTLLPVRDGRWVARDGGMRRWTLEGPPWLSGVIESLTRARTSAEVRDLMPNGLSEEEVRRALNELIAEGVVEIAASEPGEQRDWDVEMLARCLSRWGIGSEQIRQVRAACPIRVVGKGSIASDLQTAVKETGLTSDYAGGWTDADAETTHGLHVAVEDGPGTRDWHDLNDQAIRHHRSWMWLSGDLDTGWIGPLFVPGQTACWACFQQRLNSNRRSLGAASSTAADELTTLPDDRAIVVAPPSWIRKIIVNLAVAEILRYLFGHQPCRCLGRLLVVDLRTYATNSEAVLSVPSCSSCGGPPASRSPPERRFQDAALFKPGAGLQEWQDLLVARRCGIIRGAREVPGRWDDPRLFVVTAEVADLRSLGGWSVSPGGGGGGLTASDAWRAAVGEAAERYCAGLPPSEESVKTCKWSDFDGSAAVDPESVALYSGAQYRLPEFPFDPFRRDTLTDWVEGSWLSGGRWGDHRLAWLPADLVYLGFPPRQKRSPLAVATSTGLAAGPTAEAAILSALCEVIERDAFVVAWRNGLSAPQVDLASDQCRWHREILEDCLLWPRIDYRIADLTPDTGVPTYAVVSRGPSEDGDVISFGAATHPDARTAVLKALIEAGMGRKYIREELRRRPGIRYRRDGLDVRTFEDHAQFYTRRPRLCRHLFRLVSTRLSADLDRFDQPGLTGAAAIEAIVNRIESVGLRACWSDLTTPDVGSAGLRVVRVLVPGTQLLHGDHLLPFLGGQRQDQPERVFAWCTTRAKRRNPWPHPYP